MKDIIYEQEKKKLIERNPEDYEKGIKEIIERLEY